MKLIVGLGNPGKEYENTRHNAGFMVVDRLSEGANVGEVKGDYVIVGWREDRHVSARTISLNAKAAVFAKPQTFMNDSGKAVKELSKKHKVDPTNILIVHDDLDIPLSFYKLQFGKGPRLHNGITSVENHLGTKDFWRLRVGIENRSKIKDQRSKLTGEDYVLQNFSAPEKKVLENLIKEKIAPEIQNWLLKN